MNNMVQIIRASLNKWVQGLSDCSSYSKETFHLKNHSKVNVMVIYVERVAAC